jgi:hypothetical protein
MEMEIVRQPRPFDDEAFIWAMWLMYGRCPSTKTSPGEPVDLGEIGPTTEKNWERLTPYSLAKPR